MVTQIRRNKTLEIPMYIFINHVVYIIIMDDLNSSNSLQMSEANVCQC